MKRGHFDQNFSTTLFTPTYITVAVSRSELKPTLTFTVMHIKFSLHLLYPTTKLISPTQKMSPPIPLASPALPLADHGPHI